ncbi:MAG: hypothetical protein E7016_03170, partial [Alphaproteobacteria bacterium]|nr:hypothetical protein [Alphaproteobacteria bacterium]
MALSKLTAKIKDIKYLPFTQGCITYNLYDMPKGFVIKGNLDLWNKGLTELPDLSEVVVKGYFNCSQNQLTSLEGAPQRVGGDFYCNYNRLTSLEGAPKEVGGDFGCRENKLTSLKGAPQTVGGDFYCSDNQLTSLVGLPLMKESMKIYCDDSLMKKYGFYIDDDLSYEQLCESPLYKSETAMNRVRSKLPPKQVETKE